MKVVEVKLTRLEAYHAAAGAQQAVDQPTMTGCTAWNIGGHWKIHNSHTHTPEVVTITHSCQPGLIFLILFFKHSIPFVRNSFNRLHHKSHKLHKFFLACKFQVGTNAWGRA